MPHPTNSSQTCVTSFYLSPLHWASSPATTLNRDGVSASLVSRSSLFLHMACFRAFFSVAQFCKHVSVFSINIIRFRMSLLLKPPLFFQSMWSTGNVLFFLGLISTSSNDPNNRCLYWLARDDSILLQSMTMSSWLKIYNIGWQRSFPRKVAFGSKRSIVVIAPSSDLWSKSGCHPLPLVRFPLQPICLRQTASAPSPYLLKFYLTFLIQLCKWTCLNVMRWMSGFPWWRTTPPSTISNRLFPRLANSSNSRSSNFVPLSRQKPFCTLKLRLWLRK